MRGWMRRRRGKGREGWAVWRKGRASEQINNFAA